MKKKQRKGMTLAEICIVMAVVAIVSLSVTSFATMASGRGTAAATKLDAMGDLEIVEAVVESWILEAAKDPENEFLIAEDKSNITATDKNGIVLGSIMRSGHTLNVIFPGNTGAVFYQLKTMKNLEFAAVKNEDETAAIYYCTVTYEYRNGIVTKEQTYTFCVYPRVGEIVSASAQ
ncbi:MAG: prepilin-type N-terminal cleavage/methylation domain-containing protein [Ruminococcaceae bacterium]|nr:prepilin-type N-terminal cleavage/methylation domain-containing protein [Oscillospiraceae bacterium]